MLTVALVQAVDDLGPMAVRGDPSEPGVGELGKERPRDGTDAVGVEQPGNDVYGEQEHGNSYRERERVKAGDRFYGLENGHGM